MITSIKRKEYVIQCKMNNTWCPVGDFEDKAIAVDTMLYKKKQQKTLKWRTLERVTLIKEKVVS